MGTARKRIALALAIAFTLWIGVGALTAFVSTQAAPSPVPARSELEGHPVTRFELSASDGVRTAAWFADAGTSRCAVLLSGIHGNRTASLPRARFWLARGWSVLLPDLRGTGESDPEPISFGWNERLDVAAWVGWLRGRGTRTIALHGQSLGAAAAVYAAANGTQVELLVLDACYDTAKAALERRLAWVPLPSISFLPVRVFTQLRIGISPAFLCPVDFLARVEIPTFFAVGSEDPTLGREAPRAMLAASAATHKRLFEVAGAKHEELWLRDPAGLTEALGAFVAAAGIE